MAVAQGIKKQTNIVKQSALGVPGSSGSATRRRITSIFKADRDTFESNEIVSHQQSTGVGYGIKKPNGKLNGLLSPGTYKLELASLFRKDFVAGVNTTALTNVTAASTSGAQGTFTRAAGSYLTDGFKIFDILRWTGWTAGGASNNSINMMIINLTATVMTVTRFDGIAVGAKASGDSVTGTVVGKKTLAPLTGHTNDYFSIEEWYSDLSKSEFFTDCKCAKAEIGLPATGNATINFDWLSLLRTISGSQVMTSPTAETTTPILTAVNGALWYNTGSGGLSYPITGGTLTLDGSMSAIDAEVGSNQLSDVNRGRIKVSGSFTGLFKDTVLQALYEAQTVIALVFVVLDSTAGTSSFVAFNMGRIKLTGDAPDDGEKAIVRTYPFVAEINSAGGASLANDQTICSLQDSDA